MIVSARVGVLVVMMVLAAGCASWGSYQVRPPGAAMTSSQGTYVPPKRTPTEPTKVRLVEGDIADRPYEAIADISVTVNKTTIFHPDPTRAMVAERLREEAAKLGADAVIHVRYGTVGIGVLSWGSLDANGRAVVYK